ncbi:MAG: hypothetical protein E7661_00595 [Ruminococcaceae bacterium]|nr:hypothetical protein [Oscillospiraceae bacterium]
MKQLMGSTSKKARGAWGGSSAHFLLRVGFILLMLGLIAFWIYQLVSHVTVGLDTLRTQEITENAYVDLELYVFRDEELIAPAGTIYEYHVSDGERVGKNDTVATAYAADGDTARVQALLNLYARRLALAQKESGGTPEDMDTISKDIDDAYLALLSASDRGEMNIASDAALRVEEGLRQYAALVGNLNHDADGVEAMKSAVKELLDGYTAVGQIITQRSGYFYYDTDGYERLFDADMVMTMTPEEFLTLCQTPAEAYEGGVAGKMVYGSTWYAVAYVSLSDVAETAFEVGDSYTMICDDSAKTQLSMTVARMEPTEDGAMIVFKTNDMPDSFSFNRRIGVQTVTDSMSGYRIPTEALVTLTSPQGKAVTGVYILSGNVVEFRKVHISIARDGYTMVATYEEITAMLDALTEEEKAQITADGWSYLRLNDKIITRGTGLYEGKMIS